jgi:hypothetical protein
VKRNYATIISLAALAVALPLPLLTASIFTEQVGTFGSRVGPIIYLWLIYWVGSWTLLGFMSGVGGLWLSFHHRGSRWLAGIATGSNLLLLAQAVKSSGLF